VNIVTLRNLALFTLLLLSGYSWAASVPVALLTQAEGIVEFSKDGNDWKPVTRNKLLKSGYFVRTGAESSALLVDQNDNSARSLGANTQVKVGEGAVELLAGELSEPREGNDLMGTLRQRFAKVQRHTTVRRSVQRDDGEEDTRLSTAKRIVLSATYPDLVWESVGPELSYRLTVGANSYPVAATAEPLVRFTVPTQAAGEHDYQVEVVQGDQVVFTPRRPGTILWLSQEQEAAVASGLEKLRGEVGNDAFFIGAYLSDQGLEVPAMESFQAYFAEADDNELRPLLIATYHSLKLKSLRLAEAQRYNEALND